jgi:nitrate reductase delta subunit
MKVGYNLFAEILEYPTEELPGQVKRCWALLSHIDSEAADLLQEFQDFVDQTSLDRLMEIYSSTFDLQVVCYPYVGYQLFGESYKRGAFLVGLKEHYRMYEFSSAENELPDHLAVIMRFVAAVDDQELDQKLNHKLVAVCVIPALEKMEDSFSDGKNPYGKVISALLILLQKRYGKMIVTDTLGIGEVSNSDIKIIAKEEIL